MVKDYVEQRGEGYYVAGTRVSLDSVVYGFLRGESAELIAESFPAVTLEQVYGSIAFYLAKREEIDAYLEKWDEEFDRMAEQSRRDHPALHAKLEAARRNARTPA